MLSQLLESEEERPEGADGLDDTRRCGGQPAFRLPRGSRDRWDSPAGGAKPGRHRPRNRDPVCGKPTGSEGVHGERPVRQFWAVWRQPTPVQNCSTGKVGRSLSAADQCQ